METSSVSKFASGEGPSVEQGDAISRQRERSLSSTARSLLDSANSPHGSGAEDDAVDSSLSLLHGPNASPLPQRERPRSKPTIRDGKYVCDVCSIKPFDRRCEWNKHMDKHDRPYVCKKPECSSLQGFTYSGGLLRHQREVHGLHGGAKLKLYCAIDGCKRKTQNPFTRRENLAEHMRRVHKLQTPEPTSPTSADAQDTVDAAPKLEEETQDHARRNTQETTHVSTQAPSHVNQSSRGTPLVEAAQSADQPTSQSAQVISASTQVDPRAPDAKSASWSAVNTRADVMSSETTGPATRSLDEMSFEKTNTQKSSSEQVQSDTTRPARARSGHADTGTVTDASGHNIATPERVARVSRKLVERRKRVRESANAESSTSSPPAAKKAKRKSRSNGALITKSHDDDTVMIEDDNLKNDDSIDLLADVRDIAMNGDNNAAVPYTEYKRRMANLVDHLSESRAAHKASEEALRQSQEEVEKLKRQLTDLVSARNLKRRRAAIAAAAAMGNSTS